MKEIVIHLKTSLKIKLITFSVPLVVLVIAGIVAFPRLNDDLDKVLFAAGIFFLLIYLVYMILNIYPKVFTSRPLLVINDEGIMDNISAFRLGHLTWDEIGTCNTHNSGRAANYIGINLKEPSLFAKKTNIFNTMMKKVFRNTYPYDVFISDSYISGYTVKEIVKVIRKRIGADE